MARNNKPHTQSPTTPLCTSKGCAVGWWLMPSDQRSEVPSSPYFKGNLVEELQVTTTLQATLQATLQPTATVQPPPHTEEGGEESVRKLQVRERILQVREKYKAPAEWWGRKQGYHQGRELQVQEKYKAAVAALESYKPKATSPGEKYSTLHIHTTINLRRCRMSPTRKEPGFGPGVLPWC